jgi:formate dehydrogenase beta subunit
VIVQELNAIQARFGYIPQKELYDLAERIKVPIYELHGVASFYPFYRLKPPPKATVHVCSDISCHMAGAPRLKEACDNIARASENVEVKSCSCLGQCDSAPAVMLNDTPYGGKPQDEILEMVRGVLKGDEIEHQHFHSPKGPFKTDPYQHASDRYGALRALVQNNDYANVPGKLKAANLKGMGGAGFPTWMKWDGVSKSNSADKYIVCNADESEVGTFKDRELLKNLPYLLVEAMTIAGLVTGAKHGYIYIRHEYHEQIHICEEEIKRARAQGLLGKNILGSGKDFELEVFVSPGGYVQGEETALMEAIEGHRGQPRNKPVDVGLMKGAPAFNGLWGKPTVINNVETFCYVPLILTQGADAYKGMGINGCEGLKWIGVSGDVNKPGVFEVPMGTTYEHAIMNLAGGIRGGKKMKGFAPSGPSFGLLPASMINLKLDWNTVVDPVGKILGSGAVVAVAEGRCMLDLALNFTRFYRNESCGKCVPCRVGSQKMVDLIYGLTQGTATEEDIAAVPRLSDTMVLTSICGLGQVVPSPIKSLLAFFKDEVEAHTKNKTCPAGVCKQIYDNIPATGAKVNVGNLNTRMTDGAPMGAGGAGLSDDHTAGMAAHLAANTSPPNGNGRTK